MAGDWIKIQHVTPDKPEIYQLASILGVTPEDAFGRCVRIWIWADQQSLNGHALTVTTVTLDSISRHAGFGVALSKVGWMIDNGDGTISFPNFDRNNGETSKNRAVTSERQRRKRRVDGESVTDLSRSDRDESVTREEKRREESKPSSSLRSEEGDPPTVDPVKPEKPPPNKAAQLPADFYPDATGVDLCDSLSVSIAIEIDKFRDYHKARGKPMKDWQAAWRTWARNAAQFAKERGTKPTYQTEKQRRDDATTRAIFGASRPRSHERVIEHEPDQNATRALG